jgi:hypothetical protein
VWRTDPRKGRGLRYEAGRDDGDCDEPVTDVEYVPGFGVIIS